MGLDREIKHEESAPRVGDLTEGVITRLDRGDVIVKLVGGREAIMPRDEQPRHETYSRGARVRALIVEIHGRPKEPPVVLSRTDPRLLNRLFETVVPELKDGTVVIKSAARQAGERSKIAVASDRKGVDPVSACLGAGGSRAEQVVRELMAHARPSKSPVEKIDIIEWSDDPLVFVVNALCLSPGAVKQITFIESFIEGHPHVGVYVLPDQLSAVIGKRGVNMRLAGELTGWGVEVFQYGEG